MRVWTECCTTETDDTKSTAMLLQCNTFLRPVSILLEQLSVGHAAVVSVRVCEHTMLVCVHATGEWLRRLRCVNCVCVSNYHDQRS